MSFFPRKRRQRAAALITLTALLAGLLVPCVAPAAMARSGASQMYVGGGTPLCLPHAGGASECESVASALAGVPIPADEVSADSSPERLSLPAILVAVEFPRLLPAAPGLDIRHAPALLRSHPRLYLNLSPRIRE